MIIMVLVRRLLNLIEARWAGVAQLKHKSERMDGESIASRLFVMFETDLLNGYISCYAEN